VAKLAMIRQSHGGLVEQFQTWLGGLPVVCDLVCKADQRRSRAWHANNPSARRSVEDPLSQQDIQNELDRKKQELEDELKTDLRRLADERRESLHRLDWELAEAVEELHADTARKANERISQHKEVLAELEERMRGGEVFSKEQVDLIVSGRASLPAQGHSNPTSHCNSRSGSDPGSGEGSGEEGSSNGDGSDDDEPGMMGRIANFFQQGGVSCHDRDQFPNRRRSFPPNACSVQGAPAQRWPGNHAELVEQMSSEVAPPPTSPFANGCGSFPIHRGSSPNGLSTMPLPRSPPPLTNAWDYSPPPTRVPHGAFLV